MSDSGRRKGRSRRSCCLSTIGIIVLVLVAAAGAFAWFYNHPISNDKVHERVLRRLERISGLGVAYDSAALTLATGQYKITNLRFLDPAQPDVPVLTVGEVLATIHPWQLISNPESVITKVVLKDPSRLDLVYSVDSLKLGERTQFLVDAVRKAQPPGSDNSGQLPFDELTIQNAEVAFTETQGILPDLAPVEAAMVMRGNIVVVNEGESALDFQFAGQANQPSADIAESTTTSTMASGVQASIILDQDNKITVKGEAEQIALVGIFREMPGTSVHASKLAFDITTAAENDQRLLKGAANADTFSLVSPEKSIVIKDEAVKLLTDVSIDTSSSLATIRNVALDSAGALASTSGTISYGSDQQYAVAFSGRRLAKSYRQMLERLLPHGWDIEASRDSLAVDLHITGGETITSLNGTLAMRGLSLQTPALPAALTNLHGDLDFAKDTIKLVDITAEYAGARLALEGSFDGDLWQKRIGNIAVNWSTAVSLEEVLKLHGNQIVSTGQPITGSGMIRGHGTWQQAVNLGNPAESGIPGVEGEIDFENVSLQYPLLPAPVAGLTGRTRITDNTLEVSNLTGKMQGSEMTIDGRIVGDRFFWRDPEVSASLTSRLDLAQLGPYLSAQQKANLDKYQVTGTAETEMLMNGPLDDLGNRFTGVVSISDVSFTPQLGFMQGTFTGVSGVVTWDGSVLHLDDVTGRINEEDIALAGDISANKIDLRVDATPSLETVQKTFPYMDKYLEMSGGSTIDLRFTAGNDTKPEPTAISQMFEAASALADQSVNDKTFALNGSITFDDATIRHIAMPLARTENGRNIPTARVTNMKGTLTVNNDTLTVPDNKTISCSFADTPNCRLSGSIKIRPGHFPAMKVTISSGGVLRLDTWATGWGKGLDRPPRPPMTNSKYDLEAEIIAPAVVFRGQEAGRSRATVLFNMVQNNTPRITQFRNVVIQGNRQGQGRIIGNGRIESFVWNEQEFPKWQTSLDIQSMPLESMLSAVFLQPANMRGMASGNMELTGVGANPRSVRGRGSSFMQNLEIGGTAVIQQLGQTTGRNFGGRLFQTAQAATFEVGNGALSSRDLALETNGLMLEMRGDYWFAGDPARGIQPRTIDGSLRLRLFKSVFGSIPIVGQVADLADEVTNAFLLAFRVTGTAAAPRITPIALPMFQGGA